MAKKQLEKEIQLAICDYLALKKYFFWRQNTTAIFDPTTKFFRPMPKYAMRGVSDIILVKQGGKICFLEVKRPNGKLSEGQIEFKDRCEKFGAEYYIVSSIDDIINLGL